MILVADHIVPLNVCTCSQNTTPTTSSFNSALKFYIPFINELLSWSSTNTMQPLKWLNGYSDMFVHAKLTSSENTSLYFVNLFRNEYIRILCPCFKFNYIVADFIRNHSLSKSSISYGFAWAFKIIWNKAGIFLWYIEKLFGTGLEIYYGFTILA